MIVEATNGFPVQPNKMNGMHAKTEKSEAAECHVSERHYSLCEADVGESQEKRESNEDEINDIHYRDKCQTSVIRETDLPPHFRCENCDRLFEDNLLFNEHMKTHILDREYACEVCERKFSSSDDLKTHLLTHLDSQNQHEEEFFHCKDCNMTYRSITGLKFHQRIKHSTVIEKTKELSCPTCQKKFSTIGNLKKHLRIHKQDRKYTCVLCTKSFVRKEHLTRHMFIHSTKPAFKCKECQMEFRSDQTLRNHVFRDHRKELPYKCQFCGLGCLSTHNRVEHERTHTGIKPFKCDDCGKQFSRPQSLKTHKLIHSGEKPFQCKQCYMGFTQKGNLTTHMRLHTNDRPYQCMFCEKSYPQKMQLDRHEIIQVERLRFHCRLTDGLPIGKLNEVNNY